MKAAELNGLSDEQLVHKALELERTLMGHGFRHRLGQLENTSLLRKARRDLARVKTVITAREQASALADAVKSIQENGESGIAFAAGVSLKANKGSLLAKHRGTFVPAAPAKAGAEAGSEFLSGILDKGQGAE